MWPNGQHQKFARRNKPNVSAIFVHAGAGYHSLANERIHLEACNEAAIAAMRVLKAGGSAVDAVEVALKSLEDKEITNAGFGSNLAIDGTVECDATIVDHFGRSGACGAVPNIKNPISLAKLILKQSNQPLSLRRVPPNLLIGEGAKQFAYENGMPTVPNDWLVSRNAQDRYKKWKQDLQRIEAQMSGYSAPNSRNNQKGILVLGDDRAKGQRDHTNAILTATWNEGQPDSPALPGTPVTENGPTSSNDGTESATTTPPISVRSSLSALARPRFDRSPLSSIISPSRTRSFHLHTSKRQKVLQYREIEPADPELTSDRATGQAEPILSTGRNGTSISAESGLLGAKPPDRDHIVDTVGAIAIDQYGNMAGGSSSGGIGMKHCGRVGPAALVGVGTAVLPYHDQDPDRVMVGAVTSGTGEHMATTMASQKCAERLYQGMRRGEDGYDVKEEDEVSILNSFILKDFQDHPGVRNSTSAGAIGAMAVKKTPRGYYLYFAHNTDSFALASMGSGDRQPHCVMSRIQDLKLGVAQGARRIDAQ